MNKINFIKKFICRCKEQVTQNQIICIFNLQPNLFAYNIIQSNCNYQKIVSGKRKLIRNTGFP